MPVMYPQNDTSSISDVDNAVEWICNVIKYRIENPESEDEIPETLSFPLSVETHSYIQHEIGNTSDATKVAVMLAYVAYWYPEKLNPLQQFKNQNFELRLIIGGIETNDRFLPTLQTALFLLGGKNRKLFARYYNSLVPHWDNQNIKIQLSTPRNGQFYCDLDKVIEASPEVLSMR